MLLYRHPAENQYAKATMTIADFGGPSVPRMQALNESELP